MADLLPNLRAVRQQMADERLGRANIIGQLGPGGHGALAGGLLAEGLGGIFGGSQDPRLAKAQAFQQVEQEMSQMGLEPGSPEFTRNIYSKMLRVGQPEALQAYQAALELEQQSAEVEGIRQAPAAAQAAVERRARVLMQVDRSMTPELAFDIAQNKELFESVVKEATKGPTEKVRTLQELMSDPKLMAAERSLRASGAMQFNFNDKVAQATELQRAKAKTADTIARDKAAPVIQEYVRLLRNRPDASDVQGLIAWGVEVSKRQDSAAQAIARIRNPSRVTDDDVRQAARFVPGPGSALAPGGLDAAVRALETELGLDLGSSGPARKKNISPADLSNMSDEELRKLLEK